MARYISLLLVVLGVCLTGAAAELELELAPLEAMEKVWGGSCLQDRDCAAPVSHCDKASDGTSNKKYSSFGQFQ